MNEEIRQCFSEMGRKSDQASRGSQTVKLRGRVVGRESYFQRLFKEFYKHEELIEAQTAEYPGVLDRLETQEEFEK
jgi:hypothetical protein